MRDLISILITVLGVFVFIAILPTLLWLIVVFGVAIIAYIQYQKWKYHKMMHNMEDDARRSYEDIHQSSTTYEYRDDGVIDVEYTEREDE